VAQVAGEAAPTVEAVMGFQWTTRCYRSGCQKQFTRKPAGIARDRRERRERRERTGSPGSDVIAGIARDRA
jgi:hypothetical protein